MSHSEENFEPHHAACTAPRRTPWLEVVLNPVVRPSTGISTPNSYGSAVQTTPHSARNDYHSQQPADSHQHIPEVQNVEVKRFRQYGRVITHPKTQAPGGAHETSADQTEEDEDQILQPVENAGGLTQIKEYVCRLLQWLKEKGYICRTFNEALAAGIEAISKNREAEYREHRLLVLHTAASEAASASQTPGDKKRRDTERELFQELSRYYRLGNKPHWTRLELLVNLVNELEARSKLKPQNH